MSRAPSDLALPLPPSCLSGVRAPFRHLLRVQELQAVKLIVEKLLPFTFSSGEMRKEMTATATRITSHPELPPRRVKHLIAGVYCATKKVKR